MTNIILGIAVIALWLIAFGFVAGFILASKIAVRRMKIITESINGHR